jgi:hypothetical protein
LLLQLRSIRFPDVVSALCHSLLPSKVEFIFFIFA